MEMVVGDARRKRGRRFLSLLEVFERCGKEESSQSGLFERRWLR
jgi:hypothetical protein